MADHDTVISQTAFHEAETHHHGVSHVISIKVLLGVWAALVVGTVLTVAVSDLNLGKPAIYVAMAVALAKASLVATYFMHLRYDRPFNSIVFIGCLIFVALFLSFSMSDSHAYRNTVIVRQAPGVPYAAYNNPPADTAKPAEPAK